MSAITAIFAVLASLVGGAVIAWLFLSRLAAARTAQAVEKARSEGAVELTRLQSTLDQLTQRLKDKEAEFAQAQSELKLEQALLAAEKELRGGAEGEIKRVDAQRHAAEQKAAELDTQLGGKAKELAAERQARHETELQLTVLRTELDKERQALGEQRAQWEKDIERLKGEFQLLAKQTLSQVVADQRESAKDELDQRRKSMETMVQPIRDQLEQYKVAVHALEVKREGAYADLLAQINQLNIAEKALSKEAQDLTSALRGKATRWGPWGEIQLKRVVELAGMQEHIVFEQQKTIEGERDRPDMTIMLPNGQRIIVDSKAVTEAYMPVVEAQGDEERKQRLKEYGAKVRARLTVLSTKAYWEKMEGSPEFVVMFLPGESFFSPLFEVDPGIIEFGISKKIVLATPTTLIALLLAVAYGWRQEQREQHALEISELGSELYKRFVTFAKHLKDMGERLAATNKIYNDAVGSLERSVMPQARRMQELGAADKDALPEMPSIDISPRQLSLPELPAASADSDGDSEAGTL